jgi:signal transduction histidine kinase
MARVNVGSGSADESPGLGVFLPLLATSLALLLIVAVFCFFSWREYTKWADQARISLGTLAALTNVVSALEQSERSQQAYLLTSDARYLKTDTRASAQVEEQLTQLDRLNARREPAMRSLKDLRDAVRIKAADLERSRTLIRENNPDASIVGIKSGRWRILMDRVQSITDTLEQEEENRLAEVRTRTRLYARLSQLVSTFGSAGIFAIVLISTIRIRRLTAMRTLLTAELRHTNEDLRQFIYSASHDLQEPLRNLMVYSDLIEKRASSGALEAVQEDARLIRMFANRMRALVSDLLTYTQISEHQAAPAGFTDMNRVMAKVLDTYQMTIAEARARINSDSLPGLPMPEAHAEQLMLNLLSNAIKYRRTDADLSVQVSARLNGNDWVISVADNGIGIDPRYHVHIFGIFKRLHSATEYPGTGLGLAICRKIVNRLGGRIWVESQIGEGATFFFSVPSGLSKAARKTA